MSSESSENEEYEVEKVLAHRKTRTGYQYLVRWKGYTSAYDTWEPARNLTRCKELLNEFKAAAVRVSSSHQSTKRRQYNGRQENQHGRGQRQGSHAASSMRRNRSIALGRISPSRRNSMRPSSSQFRRPVVSNRSRNSSRTRTVTNPKVEIQRVFPSSMKRNHKTFVAKTPPLLMKTLHAKAAQPNADYTSKVLFGGVGSLSPQRVFLASDQNEFIERLLKASNAKQAHHMNDHDYASSKGIQAPFDSVAKPADRQQQLGRRKARLRPSFQTDRLVYLSWRDNMVEVMLGNPSKSNALTPKFLEELTNALDTIISSRCSIAIFSTIGDTFCSGLDISFLIEILKSPKKHDCTALKMTEIVGRFVDKLIDFPKPLVAIVQGPAIGLGCSMLALFDTVYSSDRAIFWTPHTAMGLTPVACSTYLFPKIMGIATANDMLLNGSKLTAEQAKEKGLITEVFAHESLQRNALAAVKTIASRNAEVLQTTKALIRNSFVTQLKHVNYLECNELADIWSSQDVIDNLQNFLKSIQ